MDKNASNFEESGDSENRAAASLWTADYDDDDAVADRTTRIPQNEASLLAVLDDEKVKTDNLKVDEDACPEYTPIAEGGIDGEHVDDKPKGSVSLKQETTGEDHDDGICSAVTDSQQEPSTIGTTSGQTLPNNEQEGVSERQSQQGFRPRPPQRQTQPGAVRVGGPDPQGATDDDDDWGTHTADSDPELIEVPGEMPDPDEVSRMVERERAEWERNVVVGTVIANDEEAQDERANENAPSKCWISSLFDSRRKRIMVSVLVILACIGAIIGVVLSKTTPPISAPTSTFRATWGTDHTGSCSSAAVPVATLTCAGEAEIVLIDETEFSNCAVTGSSEIMCVGNLGTMFYSADFSCSAGDGMAQGAVASLGEESEDCLGDTPVEGTWVHGIQLFLMCDDEPQPIGICEPEVAAGGNNACSLGFICSGGGCTAETLTIPEITYTVAEAICP